MKINTKGFALVEGLVVLVVLAVVGAIGWAVYQNQNKDESPKRSEITSFEECKAAGNPIMESYPEQCAANGQTFVNENQEPLTEPEQEYDAQKIKYIADFDKASESFKAALMNEFFDEARTICLDADEENPEAYDTATYIVFRKMVRDDFATAQYCGHGETSVFVNGPGSWKRVSFMSLADCTLVDKYKISKEIYSKCNLADGGFREVTYP